MGREVLGYAPLAHGLRSPGPWPIAEEAWAMAARGMGHDREAQGPRLSSHVPTRMSPCTLTLRPMAIARRTDVQTRPS
jgi:hypothetical protein